MATITQLNVAHNLLRAASDQYLTACSSINRAHTYGTLPREALPELMRSVSDEMVLIHDLGKTLLTARAILAATRNHVSFVVPICRLPDEVLVQIFQLVAAEQSCSFHANTGKIKCQPLGYPTLLTHVCSRWRQVAMASKRLWSHIDMPSYISCNEVAITRAREYISRAGNYALDVHLVEPEIDTYPSPTPVTLAPFSQLLAPVSHQIRTLDFRLSKPLRTFQCPEFSAKRYSLILSTFIEHATLGALERLIISLENTLPGFTSQHYFIEASESSRSRHSTFQVPTGNIALITIPQRELEALLFSVTNLELKGLYPRWTSKAYHGLIELRLGAYNGVSIPETDLRVILSSSPRLRHLNLGLKITCHSPSALGDTPVFLEALETLVTGQRNLDELGLFLRLIRPGSRPLSIYLDKPGRCSSYPEIPRVPFSAQIQAFFARANVEALGIAGTYNYSQVAELLGLVPRVRMLALNGICLGNIKWNACTEWSSAGFHLSKLYLLRETTIAQHFLVWLIQTHHVRTLLLEEDSKVTQTDNPSMTHDKLPLLDEVYHLGCSLESISSTEPYPMQLWD